MTPTLEGKTTRPPGKRSFTILHIGDSHTSADFLTGELRRRLQARYGRGAPGYITAGHPHIGVRTSSLKITASAGWTYKSLQRPDAVSAEFWLSGYNAVATAAGETMTFSSERPSTFDTIEIEVLRQPGGGAIEVQLDGVVETSYELKSSKLEPVVIRLQPARAATEKVREISITTKGQGTVSLASVAIYNRQSGLTYNSVGYVGAQVEPPQQVQQQAVRQRSGPDQSPDRGAGVRHQRGLQGESRRRRIRQELRAGRRPRSNRSCRGRRSW